MTRPARKSAAGARCIVGGERARVRQPARVRRACAGLAAAVLALLVPAIALAHPLGNFTINHFAAIRVGPESVRLDIVIDRAEIPAFQELQRLDPDGDGVLAPSEVERERVGACLALVPELRLALDGRVQPLRVVAAGLSLPPGAGGLPTMRLVCQFEAALATRIAPSTTLAFEDRSFAERMGWREIVVLGDGVTIDGVATAPAGSTAGSGTGVSGRLTAYPTDLLAQPLDMRAIAVEVEPGGAPLAAWTAPDAQPLDDVVVGPGSAPEEAGGAQAAAVPGGVAEDLAALVDVRDLTPLAVLGSLAIAFALGVIHALSPGHGKTIMAAYLVGAKGSSRQAVALGLAVTVSHTLGVLALAGLTLAASSVLPPEQLYPILGVVSGVLVVVIGASLLWSRLRVMGLSRAQGGRHEDDHGHGLGHGLAHAHAPGAGHDPTDDHDHGDGQGHGHDDGHGHEHVRGHGHPHPDAHGHARPDASVSWRGLIALGLSGGLVPSASALILLLGSIAAGRVAYGLVLVLGFGAGMAVVLAGIGLLIVHARRLVERQPSMAGLRGVAAPLQLATASLVVVLGVVLTGQALDQFL